MRTRIAVFADRIVGKKTLEFLLKEFPDDISAIICKDSNSMVYQDVVMKDDALMKKTLFNDDLLSDQNRVMLRELALDYSILAWWPFILKEDIIDIPRIGTINFHPSYLPYNRGMNYNFWTIVEDTPFGVSLHFVDRSIDGGDVIFQQRIEKDWTDTGATLYDKAQQAMLQLFGESYPKIRKGNYSRVKQNLQEGSFHFGKELHQASFIDLEKTYKANDLLNILRARTFRPHPGAWFVHGGRKYEVRVDITEIKES